MFESNVLNPVAIFTPVGACEQVSLAVCATEIGLGSERLKTRGERKEANVLLLASNMACATHENPLHFSVTYGNMCCSRSFHS